MKCPSCHHKVYAQAPKCPHCGCNAQQLNKLYDYRLQNKEKLNLLNDEVGLIPNPTTIHRWLKSFVHEFPGNFLSIHLVQLHEEESIESYALWAMNKPNYSIPEASSFFLKKKASQPKVKPTKDAGIFLIVNVLNKEVMLSYGYQLAPYLDKKSCFSALSPAYPYLVDQDYERALSYMRHGIRKLLRAAAKKASSSTKKSSSPAN